MHLQLPLERGHRFVISKCVTVLFSLGNLRVYSEKETMKKDKKKGPGLKAPNFRCKCWFPCLRTVGTPAGTSLPLPLPIQSRPHSVESRSLLS